MNDFETRSPAAPKATKTEAARFSEAALTPPVDVAEDSSGITLYADLPGVSKDKLELRTESDTLTIEAEIGIPLPEELQSTHTEVPLGRFRRTFTLSKDLNTSKVTAKLVQGVLTLRIPKAEHAQPKRIQVEG